MSILLQLAEESSSKSEINDKNSQVIRQYLSLKTCKTALLTSKTLLSRFMTTISNKLP